MIRGSSVRRIVGWTMAIALVALSSSLLAQARRRVSQGQPVFDPFPDARAALAQAGANDDTALSSMLATIRDGTPVFYFNVHTLASDQNARLGLVRALARFLPQIVASEPFGQAYTRLRNDAITAAAGDPPSDPSVARLDQISALRSDIDGYRGDLQAEGLSRSDRNRIQRQMSDAEDRLEALQRQANDASVRERERRSFEAAQAAYNQRRDAAAASIESSLPADVRVAVARRLTTFVETCSDVAYNARTTRNERGVTVFTRPEQESKPKLWKLCFRAGRRTTDEARRLARSWLADLARAGVHP